MPSLYIHVPFCTKKCPYCHFFVVKDSSHEAYLSAVKQEIFLWNIADIEWDTLYFGGGTPSLLDPEELKNLISLIPIKKGGEVTLELNPEKGVLEKLPLFLEAGINRLSIGVQTLDDALLKRLGRGHTAKEAADAVLMAKRCGFSNLSIDLMMEIPGQTAEAFQKTVDEAVSLPIDHVSLYNLTFEEGTFFYRKQKELLKEVAPEEERLSMLQYAIKQFAIHGLHRYEISAFGRVAKHNSAYWTGEPFLGLGPSAWSFWEGVRFQNAPSLSRYFAKINGGKKATEAVDLLDKEKRGRELFLVGLRRMEGVEIQGIELTALDFWVEKGHLVVEQNKARLTELGTLFYDEIAASLI